MRHRNPNVHLQIKIVCRLLLRRLKPGNEPEVQAICLDYLSNDFYEPFYIVSIPKKSETGFLVAYSILLGVALLLNVVAIFLSCLGKARTSHGLMVLSLIAGDFFLLCFCIPFNMSAISNPFWENNNIRCKMVSYLQNVAVFGVMLTPVAISLDRYLAIFYPIHFRSKLNKGRHLLMLCLIWSISATVPLPNLHWYEEVVFNNLQNQQTYLTGSRGIWTINKNKHLIRVRDVSAVISASGVNINLPTKPTPTNQPSTPPFQEKSLCLHSTESDKYVVIYKACVAAIFLTCFLIMTFLYTAVTYRLFKRTTLATPRHHSEDSNEESCSRNRITPISSLTGPNEDSTISTLPQYTVALLPHCLLRPPFSGHIFHETTFRSSNINIYLDENNINKTNEFANSAKVLLPPVEETENNFTEQRTFAIQNASPAASVITNPNQILSAQGIRRINENSPKYMTAKRSALLFAMILIFFFLTWFPIILFELILSLSGRSQNDALSSKRRYSFQYIACVNACLNPVFYTILYDKNQIRLKDFAKKVWVKIQECNCKRRATANRIEPFVLAGRGRAIINYEHHTRSSYPADIELGLFYS